MMNFITPVILGMRPYFEGKHGIGGGLKAPLNSHSTTCWSDLRCVDTYEILRLKFGRSKESKSSQESIQRHHRVIGGITGWRPPSPPAPPPAPWKKCADVSHVGPRHAKALNFLDLKAGRWTTMGRATLMSCQDACGMHSYKLYM